MKRSAAAAALLLTVFAGTWFVLDRTEHRPRWITVETTPAAVVGGSFEVRVKLAKSVPAAQIDCTLHRANSERRGWGYLASCCSPREAVGGGTYAFVFTVPEKAETAFVFALVFIGPTGEWRDASRAVATGLVPVGPSGTAPGALKKVSLRHYPTGARAAAAGAAAERPRPSRAGSVPSAWAHPLLAALLLAGAFFAYRAGGPRTSEPGGAADERTVWLVLAAVLAASAVVEVSGFAGHLAEWGRRLAGQVRIYDYRKPFQKAIMAAAASASVGLFILFIRAMRRPGSPRRLWGAGIGVAAYIMVSAMGVLSFHAVDVFRSLAWHGLSPFDALRGAGAATALVAAYLTARRKNAAIPT